ncbi:MAG: hypothetical protein PUE72_10845 [Lachnospiraceae bacterium]|nr:hypothetical protein [Lachnospiraceae bacterium]
MVYKLADVWNVGILQAVGLGGISWVALPICVVVLIVLLRLVRAKTGKEAVD